MGLFAALIPAAIGALGGLFKKKGEQRQQESQWETQRPGWERDEAIRAGRAQLVGSILRGLGIGGSIDPALMSRLTTPQPFPKAPTGGGTLGMIGGALGGVAPHLFRSMNPGRFESFGGPGATPATDAAEAGGVYGPSVPPPPSVNPETIERGQQPGDDDYLNLFRGVSGTRF